MKLYKLVFSDIVDARDVIFVYAENEYRAFKYACEKHMQDYKEYLLEMSLEEFLEETKSFEGEMRYLFSKGDMAQIARVYFEKVVLNGWTVEELEHDCMNSEWAVYPEHVNAEDEVYLISVDKNAKLDQVKDALSIELSRDGNFREYVEDNSVDMGLLARMHHDEMGWLFLNSPPLRLRHDLMNEADRRNISQWQYCDEIMYKNIDLYFGDDVSLKQEYLDYLKHETTLSEQFYLFVARKHIENDDWDRYTIKQVEFA